MEKRLIFFKNNEKFNKVRDLFCDNTKKSGPKQATGLIKM